jgi:hypothetical protein
VLRSEFGLVNSVRSLKGKYEFWTHVQCNFVEFIHVLMDKVHAKSDLGALLAHLQGFILHPGQWRG